MSKPKNPARGSGLPQSKLTEPTVRVIRENRNGKTQAQRAAEFGVHPNTIKRIDRCLTWRHV